MDSLPPSSLSFFELVQPVGRGAMGEVWLAEHKQGRARVAIKFLHLGEEQGQDAREALSNEVRACAHLAHPNIVTVLDHGLVDLRGRAASEGRIAVGTPYLVMEFIPGRSLQTVVGRMAWASMREVLLVLLDALAHSHARGVIHRDLKPGNVLLRQPPMSETTGFLPPEPLLTDFGVAQALTGRGQGTRAVVGTPAYMAPEQLQARWRDQGPWTDLYSIGCLAWSLATGFPPFGRGRSFEENRDAHLGSPPPTFEPMMPVPPGFEGWLRRLLEKDPGQRYARAADAAVGLLAMPGTPPRAAPPPAPRLPPQPGAPEPTGARLQALDADALTLPPGADAVPPAPVLPPAAPSRAVGGAMPPRVFPRPIQAEWRSPRPPSLPAQLLGVGLNLYGLRDVPMVGRTSERQALWDALRAVDREKVARAVLLEGASGSGTTRLGRWLCERAHELGAAIDLRAPPGGDDGTSGVGEMLARHFRVEGMAAEPRARRLDRVLSDHGFLDPSERRAMTELIGPGDGQRSAPHSLSNPGERYRLVARLLRAISRGPQGPRPLIVFLDDARWSPDNLELTRALLDLPAKRNLPVLVVLALGQGGADRSAQQRLLDSLRAHPRATTLNVPPLPPEDHEELVRLLLGMDDALVSSLARRTAGNPHYAVELIQDWVANGKLQVGPQGFKLRAGVEVIMPPDLQQTWRAQVERQLARLTTEEVRALELAAALGNQVDDEEWRDVCALTSTNPSPRLRAQLLDSQIARLSGNATGWSFSNPMYREVLELRSNQAGRLKRIHLACARMLEARRGLVPGAWERVGVHLLLGGQPIPATAALLHGAVERLERGQLVEAEQLLDKRQEVLRRLRLPTEDALWGQGWVLTARLYRMTDRSTEARELAERALASATRNRWDAVQADAEAELAALAAGPLPPTDSLSD